MKSILFLLILIPHIVFAETYNMVQAGKTFLGNITDEQASQAYDDPIIEEENKVDALGNPI